MPIIKIFSGNIANKLYSEKESIKAKSKQLKIKKTQMTICKRDMEELSLAENLVSIAKNQILALTQIEEFMNFVNSGTTYEGINITELFESLNPNYDSDSDEYTNLFAQFEYALTNTTNSSYLDDNNKVLSLKEWYPYLYQKSLVDYYQLYSEIGTHQINIYKIADGALASIDSRRNEIDVVVSLAKNISDNVNKLVDFSTRYLGTNSEEVNQIANDIAEQEQQAQIQYKENIDEDESVSSILFDITSTPAANANSVSLEFNKTVTITIMSNVNGKFTIKEQPQNATVTVNKTNGITHELVVTNTNDSLTLYTIDNIKTTFTPSDTDKYDTLENYNILTTDGNDVNVINYNLIFSIDLKPINVNGIERIEWTNNEGSYSANDIINQHYYINFIYSTDNDGQYTVTSEINKDQIVAYNSSNEIVSNWYYTRGQYTLYYTLYNEIKTDSPMTVTIN